VANKKPQQEPSIRTLYARIAPELHEKLGRMAMRASVKAGVRITMQDVVADLISKAKEER
jgi:hypothetical protein